ncbi:MAG: helix-turn-helix domain-containing protein [Gemmataceae bacterium]
MGWVHRDIAAALGVSEAAVSQWLARRRRDGTDGLLAHPHGGTRRWSSCPGYFPKSWRMESRQLCGSYPGPKPISFPGPVATLSSGSEDSARAITGPIRYSLQPLITGNQRPELRGCC